MRSDREDIPEGYTKDEADKAETMEAELLESEASVMVTPGCQVYWPAPYEVCGAIKDKYNSLGGPNSFLLWPKSNELTNPDGGKRSEFQNGPIYWSGASGAHPVVNHIYYKWSQLNWEGGYLKYPTSDEIVLQSSTDNIGRRQEFQGGFVYWHPTRSNLNAVRGAILGKYLETGAQNGPLGYPKSDELILPDGNGRMTQFEFGNIYWSPSTGVHPVLNGILTKWGMTNYEQGPYGYPISDQRSRGQAFDQDFQYGTIGWPTSAVEGDDTDWEEGEELNDSNCPGCGDDDRISVKGLTHLNVPQPNANSEGLQGQAADDPAMPQCSQVVPDQNAAPDALVWCAGTDTDVTAKATEWTSSLREPKCMDLPAKQWGADRDYACMWRTGVAELKYQGCPTPVTCGASAGKFRYALEYETQTEWNKTTWKGRSTIHILRGVAGEATQATYSAQAICTSTPPTCGVGGENAYSGRPTSERDRDMDFTPSAGAIAAGGIVETTIYATFNFYHPKATIKSVRAPDAVFPKVRCDAKDGFRNTQGCVIPDAEPVLDMTTRSVPEHAKHIRYAQASGLPGSPDGTPLTRTTNLATMQNNRNTSCNRVPRSRPSGTNCDEYPFASTNQGGGANGPARTYDGSCNVNQPGKPPLAWVTVLPENPDDFAFTGISMCLIPARDNKRGGGITTWFYTKNRVFDGEKFYVKG